MRVIDEQIFTTARGGILYDASRVRKPGDELFERGCWAANNALEEIRGGRGSIAVLRAGDERWVLRHYRRGGWMAKASHDRYLWSGQSRTRSFVEWRLLAELQRQGLPVPAPVAARYVRTGVLYRADLITEQLTGVRTLADSITSAALAQPVWFDVGVTIADFHRRGVHHADLNAHNILLSATRDRPRVYVLDFDRGRIRRRGVWEQQVLNRLHRSLEKVKGRRPAVAFGVAEWGWLMEGYTDSEQRTADSGQ